MRFLVKLELHLQAVPEASRDDLIGREKTVATKLKAAGSIVDMWRLPGRTATVSIWNATDATDLDGLLNQLPLLPWMKVEVEALANHYLTSEVNGES